MPETTTVAATTVTASSVTTTAVASSGVTTPGPAGSTTAPTGSGTRSVTRDGGGPFDVRLIPEYDGSSDVVEWFTRAEVLCKHRGVDLTGVLPARLSGGAFAVWLQMPEDARDSADAVRDALYDAFWTDWRHTTLTPAAVCSLVSQQTCVSQICGGSPLCTAGYRKARWHVRSFLGSRTPFVRRSEPVLVQKPWIWRVFWLGHERSSAMSMSPWQRR